MEIIGINGVLSSLKFPDIAGCPPAKKLSRRAYILNQIADLTGMSEVLDKNYWAFAGKFSHLKGEEGTKILFLIYDIAQTEDTLDRKRIKLWTELKKTKV